MNNLRINNNILTGLFLVILGILFLLRNFNLLDFSIGDVFRLWPITLIYIGVEMIPAEQQTKLYLQTAVIILFFVALIALPYLKANSHQNNYYEDEDIGLLKLKYQTNNEIYTKLYGKNRQYTVQISK